MRVAIASDHAGHPLKSLVIARVRALDHEADDLGTDSEAPVDYPDAARAVGAAVATGRADRGILLCGSGVGASVAANKMRGVRAAVCHDTYSARQGVEHDDMNVLTLGARVIGPELVKDLVRAFLDATFSGEERHVRRLRKIDHLEAGAAGVRSEVFMPNPLVDLQRLGQSPWHDNIRRDLITSGTLVRMIADGDITGLTSNPTIFEQAIATSDVYDGAIHALAARGHGAEAIVDSLVLEDIANAADLFQPVFLRTKGDDGYVSIEVSPRLAHDTEATIAEARRLWRTLGRPNVMVKIPATTAGIPAIEAVIADGINVNVTLIFSLARYAEVVAAYLAGLRARVSAGQDVARIASVASFFVSRVDGAVDQLVDERVRAGDPAGRALETVRGQVAIANAKLAYRTFLEAFHGPGFAALSARGARRQRPLWASTSAKNPRYPDVYYVEALVGPETVDTMPPATIAAFRDHGRPEVRIDRDVEAASATLDALASLGIDLSDVLVRLEAQGVASFRSSYESLLAVVAARAASAAGPP